MNQRGSVLLEGILSLLLLLTVFLVGFALLLRGLDTRLEEHARFFEERQKIAASRQ